MSCGAAEFFNRDTHAHPSYLTLFDLSGDSSMKRWLTPLIAVICMAAVPAMAAKPASATQPDAQASEAQSSYGVPPVKHKKRVKKSKKASEAAPASAASN
jgi:hypothetical protein